MTARRTGDGQPYGRENRLGDGVPDRRLTGMMPRRAPIGEGGDARTPGVVTALRSVGAHEPPEDAWCGAERHVRKAFDNAPIGMCVASVEPQSAGRFLRVNRAFCEMLGYSEETLLATDFQSITHPNDREAGVDGLRRLAAGEIADFEIEKRYLKADGRSVWAQLNASVVRDASGNPLYSIAQIQDITERKNVEQRLGQTAAIVQASDDAIIAATTEGTITSWNPGAERLLGFSAGEIVGQPVTSLVPEHRRGEEAEIFETLRAGGTTSSHETERLRKDGSLAEVSLTVSPVRDSAGSVVGAAAILRDTSRRRRAEEAARQAERRFRGAFDNAPVGMALVASDGGFSQVNRSLCEITGYTEQDLLSSTLQGITHPDDRVADLGGLLEGVGGGLRTHRAEKRFLRVDGRVVWGLLGASRIDGSEDQSASLIVQIEDITERKQAEERLMYLADHDALTGLYNRGRWELELSRQIAYADRYGNGIAVLLLDLDNLKGVNDTLGHEAGDDLLKNVARALDERLRKTDMVGRLGGDEFAVLLPHAGPGRARRVAEILLRAVRDAATPGDKMSAGSTISIGIALGDGPDGEGPGLLARADLALYEAKMAGGDRIAVHQWGGKAADG